ncbi:hypothetical protein BU24DRAFT_267719 [Aaosphaeria arxii CBS 175.79]|uniref:Uncharacterized protein n=1 Tax=Aaosphaeria arxii CBS 175.79 TaxID=1450172 RepID=A0A6A5XGN4_9PLEO|nr:uncharacterized protein BU24DRAFT_267719 [Aaosphaeria arxii CBS 175.79]KAF2012019.1 hypothetical protein BU24DRAFT_267719 [Aaosphaeria arxii CBS 175.79]
MPIHTCKVQSRDVLSRIPIIVIFPLPLALHPASSTPPFHHPYHLPKTWASTPLTRRLSRVKKKSHTLPSTIPLIGSIAMNTASSPWRLIPYSWGPRLMPYDILPSLSDPRSHSYHPLHPTFLSQLHLSGAKGNRS